VRLSDKTFIDSITRRHYGHYGSNIRHATDRNAAKLLMTQMRDAGVAGPSLREAHRRAGWYMAIEFLDDVTGLEGCQILHVQGHRTGGRRLLCEMQTTIVALMRGGEPMAFGVNEVFPLAMFVHLKPHHLESHGAVILVDSVVNSGKTVVEFVQHVRRLNTRIRIVVVSGVVQAESVFTGPLARVLGRDGNISLLALRLSKNQFTSRGTSDIGNRLFNTTRLD
jgi:uracil phosphoribosyltransferase